MDAAMPLKSTRGCSSGFTLIEIVVVMVLMSVITAVLLGRSITTSEVDVVGQTDKIRNHLRYAQAMAMKRSDAQWGIEFPADQYAFIKIEGLNLERPLLPGGDYNGNEPFILESELGIDIDIRNLPTPNNSAIIFDRLGKPYTVYPGTPLTGPVSIDISAGGESRTITVEAETGLIK